ncbi:GDP-mannose 4,6-dehydratase, partial [Candidatus Uhrbacteria bacterium]|nr:GDP-mannose 4,6-dehydratase [Candidatus Uhrbacteria bacterium]
MRRILVTGGAGFIGSSFVRHLLRVHDDVEAINFDKLTYAGNLENLREIEGNPRYRFVRGDIGDLDAALAALKGVDTVVNFAAESHND